MQGGRVAEASRWKKDRKKRGKNQDSGGVSRTDERIRSWLGGTKETKVIDTVEGEETREGGRVDLSSDWGEERLGRVGDTVGIGRGDLGVGDGGEQERCESEHVYCRVLREGVRWMIIIEGGKKGVLKRKDEQQEVMIVG